MRICVVVPMYNESSIARNSIETVLSYVRRLPSPATLLVVDDGSDDGTGEIVKKLAGEIDDKRLQVISHPANKGYGAALRTGIKFAVDSGYDYAVFMDSDLTNHPRYLEKLHEKMVEGWDYIKVTRYAGESAVEGVPWKRKAISKYANIFAKFVTGLPISDITNGFRAVKVGILARIELKEDSFPVIIEELMKARKLTNSFCEIPYVLYARDKNAGRTKFTHDPATFWKYFKYLFI